MNFGEFTFAGDVPLATIAELYGFAIPETEKQMALAEFVRARLRRPPTVRDRITFHDRELVIQGMDGERITRVGLQLESPVVSPIA